MSTQHLRVLVTGSAGAVGKGACAGLIARGHYVRGADLRSNPQLEDEMIGDLTDRGFAEDAVSGMDALVHLAAYPTDGDFMTQLLPANIVGLYNVLESAAAAGIERAVVASSCHVGGRRKAPDRPRCIDDGSRARSFYGVTKVFAESMAEMYAGRHRMSTVAVRIGWTPRDLAEMKRMHAGRFGTDIYLSPNDAGLFFHCAVTSKRPLPGKSVVVFATSRAIHGQGLDPKPARLILGYEAQEEWPMGADYLPGFTSVEDLA